MILLWAFGFWLSFGTGLGQVISYVYEMRTGTHLIPSIELLAAVGLASVLAGGVGFLLGILGLLPGTRRNDDDI